MTHWGIRLECSLGSFRSWLGELNWIALSLGKVGAVATLEPSFHVLPHLASKDIRAAGTFYYVKKGSWSREKCLHGQRQWFQAQRPSEGVELWGQLLAPSVHWFLCSDPRCGLTQGRKKGLLSPPVKQPWLCLGLCRNCPGQDEGPRA